MTPPATLPIVAPVALIAAAVDVPAATTPATVAAAPPLIAVPIAAFSAPTFLTTDFVVSIALSITNNS